MKKLGLGFAAMIVLLATSSVVLAKGKTIEKNLGDINGDGRQETLIARVSSGGLVGQMVQGGRIILSLPPLMTDTADGYQIVGKKVVVWSADRQTTVTKSKGFWYDFFIYRWDPSRKRYVKEREAYTKVRYHFAEAKKLMPQLTVNPGSALVFSAGSTFKQDALRLASKHFGKKYTRVRDFGYPPQDYSPHDAKSYLVGDKGAYVTFHRDGSPPTVDSESEGSY
jgi:hypothetical protein